MAVSVALRWYTVAESKGGMLSADTKRLVPNTISHVLHPSYDARSIAYTVGSLSNQALYSFFGASPLFSSARPSLFFLSQFQTSQI